jgi:hypothetical protein
MVERVLIPARFNGPRASGQGGYSCGVAGRLVRGSAAEVRLRAPPPLDTYFDVHRSSDGSVQVNDGDRVVMDGRPVDLTVDLPTPVTMEKAKNAAHPAEEIVGHPFPTCFGCGPERAEGDGLRLFPGFIDARQEQVACPLVFERSFAGDDGVVPVELVWAALDCPSGWALHGGDMQRVGTDIGLYVTGTIAAAVDAPLRVDEPHVVMGWRIGSDGRKLFTGSAIFTEEGAAVARCRQTWIVVK